MESQQQEASFFNKVARAKEELDDVSMPPASDASGSTTPSSPDLTSTSSRAVSVSSAPTPRSPAGCSSVADSFVFAFDIDGVLVRGGEAIPEAMQAMRVLNGENEFGLHV